MGASVVSQPYLYRDHITIQFTIAVQIRVTAELLLLVDSAAKVRKLTEKLNV